MLMAAVSLGFGVAALAQEAAPAVQPTAAIDEVVVPGVKPENLRIEIERLEVAVYDRFNALNSNDDFDIHCLEAEPTGSNITKRTCAPNFVIRSEAQAAVNGMRDARNRADARTPAADQQRMEELGKELTAEMQRVAREDEELMRDLVRLDQLRQMQIAERERRGNR
jgi:hypothetical protein